MLQKDGRGTSRPGSTQVQHWPTKVGGVWTEVSSLEVEFNLSDGTRAPTGEELVNFSPPPTPWTSLWPLLNLIKQRWTSCWLAEKKQVFFRKLWWNIEEENWTTCPKMKYGPQNICMTQPFILIQVISSLDIMSRYHKMYIVIQWKIRTKLQERRWSCLEECQPRWYLVVVLNLS